MYQVLYVYPDPAHELTAMQNDLLSLWWVKNISASFTVVYYYSLVLCSQLPEFHHSVHHSTGMIAFA